MKPLEPPSIIRAASTGSSQIEEVRLFIRERSSGRFLAEDNTFGLTPTPRTIVPSASGKWSLSLDLPPGEYALNVRVFDEDGRSNEFPPFRHYSVVAR